MRELYKVHGIARLKGKDIDFSHSVNVATSDLISNLGKMPCKVISDVTFMLCEYSKVLIAEVKVIMCN